MKYLVDANVLSEPTRSTPNGQVLQWLRSHEQEIVIDPIILGEIRFGINLLPASNRRRLLEKWFSEGVQRIHCLSWEAATALRWAQFLADLRSAGHAMPVKDSLIAATALLHGLTVVTRNVADFARTGIQVLNPFV